MLGIHRCPSTNKGVDAVFRTADGPFADVVKSGEAITPQIEAWAKQQTIQLDLGWKVDVAKRVKQRLLSEITVDDRAVELWRKLFETFAPELHAAQRSGTS